MSKSSLGNQPQLGVVPGTLGNATLETADSGATNEIRFSNFEPLTLNNLSILNVAGVLNVGAGVETSVLDLYARIQGVAGIERAPEFAEPRAGELQRSVLDASRARRELGWEPQRSLDEGLAATWAWISEQ